jgi:glutamine cyclotransferase
MLIPPPCHELRQSCTACIRLRSLVRDNNNEAFMRLITRFMSTLSVLLLLTTATAKTSPTDIPIYTYRVVARYPHDPKAFTQGLIFKNGFLYESTGLRGQSTVRKVRLETGEVVQKVDLPFTVFGEGLTDRGEQLLVLTWTSNIGYILDRAGLAVTGTFAYAGEGWGLTRSPDTIFMSDGSAYVRLMDPQSLQERGRIQVTDRGTPVARLNELEWVKGEIFANVWQTDRIARIDPKSGNVVGWIDLTGLDGKSVLFNRGDAVLNGIAYDSARDRLFVTGKLWPEIYEIKLIRKPR